MDYAAHNAEVKRVWEAFHSGSPCRVPVVIGTSVRSWLLDASLNTNGVTFEEFTLDPDVMLREQLLFRRWVRLTLMQDAEMGLPEAWNVHVDFQNMYEAAWLGAPIRFEEGNCPYAAPLLNEEDKWSFLDEPIPDPFEDGGWMERNWEYCDHFCKRRDEGYEFAGRPLGNVTPSGTGTDGPFTLAATLRGTDVLADLMLDPDYFNRLMSKLTDAILRRMRAYRQRLGHPERGAFGFADDSVAMLSAEQYRRAILPHHRRLVEEFGDPDKTNSVHLCGDAQHLFPVLRDELNVRSFDTGFPVDWDTIRRDVGADSVIYGGPPAQLFLRGPAGELVEEAKRILASPAARGGRFVAREGNNLAPCTPPEHVRIFYETVVEFGRPG